MKPKLGDIVIISVISVLTVLSALIFWVFGENGKTVVIKKDNADFLEYPIDTDGEYEISTEYGENTLVIENGKAYFKNSNCPDKTCEKTGKIENVGESIVCLPHKIVAEVRE